MRHPSPQNLNARSATGVDAREALESWLKVSRALVEDVSLGEVLDLIASVARDLSGNLFAIVALVDEEGERLVIRGSAGLRASYLAFNNDEYPFLLNPLDGHPETPSVTAFRSGSPAALLEPSQHPDFPPEYREAIEEQGFCGVLSVPLRGPGELGVLTVYAPTPDAFEQAQVNLLSALAHGAAAAIEIARLRGRELTVMAELREVDLLHQRLTQVALADKGLDSILRSLASMTGFDMYVEDVTTGGPIAAWPSDHKGPEVPAAAREALRRQAVGRHELVEMSSSDSVGGMTYATPVVLAGAPTALLWASGHPLAMTHIQQQIFERGAMVVALELLKRRHAQEVAWNMRGDLMRDLMNMDVADEARLMDRARAYGHDLNRPYVVLVGSPDPPADRPSGGTDERGLRHLIACTRSIATSFSPGSLVASRDGTVVMLMPHDGVADDAPRRAAETIVAMVGRGVGTGTASVSIGDACARPRDYRAATRAATTAVRMSQLAGARRRVVDVADLGVFRLLLSVDDPALLRSFSERVLGPLRQHTDARRADLVETLQVYLENNLQVGQTAAQLHVHPNTLSYRLRRIESLTGVELRSNQGLLEFTLALALDRLTRAS